MADQLKKQRQPIRGSFTRTVNELKALLEVTPQDQFAIQLKFTKISEVYEHLKSIDRQLIQSILDDDVSEAEYNQEENVMEQYDDEWREVRLRMEASKPTSPPTSPANSEFNTGISQISTSDKRKTYKLPKVEVKKFGGDLKDWLRFWSQFKRIHEDEELHGSDKFQYLVQSMEIGSKAHTVVSRYSVTEENYPKAVKALQERFGKVPMLVIYYVRELIRLIVQNSQEKVKIEDVFDQLETQLQSLESLGVVTDQANYFLYTMIESCLPEDVLTAWQRSTHYEDTMTSTQTKKFRNLIGFIQKEVEAEQLREMAQEGFFKLNLNKKESKDPKLKRSENLPKFQKSDIPTAAGLFVGQEKSCIFCEKAHSSQDCGSALSMSLEEKKEKFHPLILIIASQMVPTPNINRISRGPER